MASGRGRGLRPGGVVRAVLRLVLLVAVGFGVGLVFGIVTEEPELLAGHLRGEGETVALDPTIGPDGAPADAPGSGDPSHADDGSETGGPQAAVSPDVYASAVNATRPLVEPAERVAAASLPEVAAPRRSAPAAASTPGANSTMDPAAAPPAARSALEARSSAARPPAAVPVAAALAVPESARAAVSPGKRWAIQVGAFSEQAAAERLADGLRDRYPVAVLPANAAGGRYRVRVQPIEDESEARSTAERLKRDERLPTWVTPMEGHAGS